MRRAILLLVLSLGASACGGGANDADVDRPMSALILTLDTTRYDALGVLGGPAAASPRLDALAREGVVYTMARTVAPLTTPAHASLMTGLTPMRHTVHVNSQLALPQSATTLAERASERGFQTGAFVAAVVLARDFALDQGFEVYEQPKPPLVQTTRHYDRLPANEVADATIGWIDRLDPARPFLGWAHFFDPHLPYASRPELAAKVGGSEYHAEVAFMDAEIGRVLDALKARGLYDNTIIVVIGDHGEALGDHGEDTHGAFAYDATIRVPMLVRYPDGHRAGERSDEVTSIVDVYPTLVEALGLGAASDVDGISLFHRAVPADRGVYFETYYGFHSYGWSPVVGWADARGKYLFSSDPEFFAMPGDLAELRNLHGELDAARLAPYRDALEALARRPALERGANDAAGAGVIGMLQALGYTGAGGDGSDTPGPLEELPLPSPASMLENYRMMKVAQVLVDTDRAPEAVVLFRRITAANPGNPAAWFQLGGALILTEQHAESIQASQAALDAGPRWHGPLKNIGLAHRHLGNPEAALTAYAEALELAPHQIDVLESCIAICEELKRPDEANLYRMKLIEAREAEASR